MFVLRCIVVIPIGLALVWGLFRFMAYCLSLTYNGPTKMVFYTSSNTKNLFLDRLDKTMEKGNTDENK